MPKVPKGRNDWMKQVKADLDVGGFKVWVLSHGTKRLWAFGTRNGAIELTTDIGIVSWAYYQWNGEMLPERIWTRDMDEQERADNNE